MQISLKMGAAYVAQVLTLCCPNGDALNHLDPVFSLAEAAVMW